MAGRKIAIKPRLVSIFLPDIFLLPGFVPRVFTNVSRHRQSPRTPKAPPMLMLSLFLVQTDEATHSDVVCIGERHARFARARDLDAARFVFLFVTIAQQQQERADRGGAGEDACAAVDDFDDELTSFSPNAGGVSRTSA
jgi:hypothetical protein